jgi:hypothetical protein
MTPKSKIRRPERLSLCVWGQGLPLRRRGPGHDERDESQTLSALVSADGDAAALDLRRDQIQAEARGRRHVEQPVDRARRVGEDDVATR